MMKGILVSCSAGNSGPNTSSVSNVAPWITTVSAGTLDRDFPAKVILGNKKEYDGASLYSGQPLPKDKMIQIVYFGDASTNVTTNASLCIALDPKKVNGKIVLCDRGKNARVEKGLVVKQAGGLGMVLASTAANGAQLVADAHVLPAVAVNQETSDKIKKYIFSTNQSAAKATFIFGGTKLGVQPSPVVAAFSSRGPNGINPEILKPDLIAPGVNILAAWPDNVGPTGLDSDKRQVKFNIISGTSMSCPHVSGLAALLKAAHPDWSPAAIRSALMTTAYSTYKNATTILDAATGEPSNPFAYGAGHVAPVRALDPGLVYDLCPLDYFKFLCALKYNSEQIEALTNNTFTCDKKIRYSVNDLNYPSFAVPVRANRTGGIVVVKHKRTLTNVGQPGTYKVSISSSSQSVKICVVPKVLTFNEKESKSYTVTFEVATNIKNNTQQFGRIEWSDGKHVVGSPIAFSWT
ncbi:hypothetical protein CASFOL_021257 [Castilleja foliolosa]|uniref:Subtilisin-like protease n=1 Tax=Castilleja foliolosa TaxID=1961234 RepID=A0ABD3CWX9_9LAMI